MKIIRLLPLLLIFLSWSGCISTPEAGNSATDAPVRTIENKGSDTIVNLALAWAEKYQTDHPDVRISVTGGGSGTGIASLINGTVDIANASRQIKPEEVAEAQKNGINPVEHVIARDAIAVMNAAGCERATAVPHARVERERVQEDDGHDAGGP